jgi:hypothetical protein
MEICPSYGAGMVTRDPGRALRLRWRASARRARASAYDAIDTKLGLASGALWWALHDIPEYRLSREGTIDRAAYRAAVRRALLEREGADGRVDAALAAFWSSTLRQAAGSTPVTWD